MKAVNAEVEPRLINPSRSSIIVTRVRAYNGMPSRLSTVAQMRGKGMPLSLANAQVVRDVATVILMLHTHVKSRTRKLRPKPPAGEPITWLNMYGSACPEGAPMMSANGGSVKQMGRMKKSPEMPPAGMDQNRAFGTRTAGSEHSSAIEVMRGAQLKQYAGGSKPIKNEKLPQPEMVVS